MAQIVVFDFDKTLTGYDTIFPFYFYSASKSPYRYLFLPIYALLKVFSKLGLIAVQKEKELGLLLMCPRRYVSFQACAHEYALKVKTDALNRIYTRDFMMYKHSGARIVIASASFTDYLKHIFPDELVIGSECSVDNQGRISGLSRHPYKQAKAKALRQEGIEFIDVFYTDSTADIPVAEMSRTVKWVKNGEIIG